MPKPLEFPDYCPRSFAFACAVVRLHQKLSRTIPPLMARQFLRAGTSIGANLEEANSAQSRRALIAKFPIALKEARETHYWLRLMVATSLVPGPVVADAMDESNQFVAILTASLVRMKEAIAKESQLPQREERRVAKGTSGPTTIGDDTKL